MERVREELICAVCLDFLREPKVLQCAHSFCSRCLREMAKAREQQRQRRSPTSARRSLDLECPSCRHVTVLEHGRVDLDLPTNVNLKRLVEIVSDEEKGRTLKVLATSCSSPFDLQHSCHELATLVKRHNSRVAHLPGFASYYIS